MSDAPKEIWAFYAPEIEEDNPKCTIVAGEHVMHGAQKYIREDVALAMVAAEREACADIAKGYHRKALLRVESDPADADRHEECASTSGSIESAIRTRTPDDAKAAFDAMFKAEREKALREAAEVCVDEADGWYAEGMYGGQVEGSRGCVNAILALIEQEPK